MAVQDHQQPLGRLKATLDEVAEKRRAGLLVFRGGLDQSQHAFLARGRHAQCHDHYFVSPNASGTAAAAASHSREEIPASTRRKRPTS